MPCNPSLEPGREKLREKLKYGRSTEPDDRSVAMHAKRRAAECRIQWCNVINPSITKVRRLPTKQW